MALSFFPAFVRPNNGGVERLYNLYAALSDEYDVTLISSSHLGGEREVISHAAAFTEIRVPKDEHFAKCYADLESLKGIGDLSGPALGQSCRQFGPLHDEYLAHYVETDIIIHDSPFLVECDIFRGFDNKIRIYNSYNCEVRLYHSFHSGAGRLPIIEDLVRTLEGDLCRHVDLITACSKEDVGAFNKEFAPAAPIVQVPNGFTPGPLFAETTRQARKVVFLGSAHKPNIDAVTFIVNELAPTMKDLEFHLIGSCHPKGRVKNVIAHGVVSREEKDALLQGAVLAINPMMSGGGSSLKIADIASASTPLISTALGARGFGLRSGIHYVLLDEAAPAQTIRDTLGDAALRRSVAAAALGHFEQNYTWRRVAAEFAEHIDGIAPVAHSAKARLVLNDYDSFAATGGGATRTQGLCRGLAETAPIIFIAFAEDERPARQVSADGLVLSLLVNKSAAHLAEHDGDNALHWMSSADIVNYVHAPKNVRLLETFRCAASLCSDVICEHPYMVGVPCAFGVNFVYSSQNFETGLKASILLQHPRREHLLLLVREAESTACGAASLIIAVSDEDARNLSAQYRATAPIMVIPNGSDGPEVEWPAHAPAARVRPVAIFMGSSHGPNIEAAQWIARTLAPEMSDIDFVIIGAVADSLEGPLDANVQLAGRVSAIDKTRRLHSADVALNPMRSGSGSNVKLADYLQHGLPVVTTVFGARGYEAIASDDVFVTELAKFACKLKSLLASTSVSWEARQARQSEYRPKLSMAAGGRLLAELLVEHGGVRKRALYVTYRYNDPARGGGEEYVVRLVRALAASGWNVDVVSPATEQITDRDRFAAEFSGGDWQPVPIGMPRIRSAKFPLDLNKSESEEKDLRQIWKFQPDFEEHVFRHLDVPHASCLAWGWEDSDARGRWAFRSAGLYLAEPAKLKVRAKSLTPSWIQIFSDDGRRLFDLEADGAFTIDCMLPAGFVSIRTSGRENPLHPDPRPLAFFAETLDVDFRSLTSDRKSDIWASGNGAGELMTALAEARNAVRDPHDLNLTHLRGSSDALENYVREQITDYDLLITHNAVFKTATSSIGVANRAGVPSILIPHLHYDDDFYHFQDVYDACAKASRTLICPDVVRQRLVEDGLDNITYHSPGVDASADFSADDSRAFREILGRSEDFFLILGRKSPAKGYRDAIRAIDSLPADEIPLLVMIGPDEDKVPVVSERVIYLGQQPREVVRGALRDCLALINMSRSESFGMVLVEAGLAGKPVVANIHCAAFADIVDDSVNGYLTSPADLSARLSDLLRDDDLRRKLGQEGRKRALKHDWWRVEKQFITLCDLLATKSR